MTPDLWREMVELTVEHLVLVVVSMAVDQTRRLFLKAMVQRWLDGICGTLFVGFGVRLALERQ